MRPEIISRLTQYFRDNPHVNISVWKAFSDGIGASQEEFFAAQKQVDFSELGVSKVPSVTPEAERATNQAQEGLKKINLNTSLRDFSISQILLGVGLILICVAVLIIIATSWPTLAPWQKFIVVAIPNGLLLTASLFVNKDPSLSHIRRGVHGVGLAMVPLTIGVALYQFGIMRPLDETLMLVALLCALPFYLYYDFVSKHLYATGLTIVTCILSLGFFLLRFDSIQYPDPVVIASSSYLILGVIFFFIAREIKRDGDRNRSTYYEISATFLSIISTPILINALILGDVHYTENEWNKSEDPLALVGATFLGGVLLLCYAGILGKLMKPIREIEFWLQRIILVAFLVAFFIPLIGAFDKDVAYSFVGVVFSLLVGVVGVLGGVALLTFSGLVMLGISLLAIMAQALDSISVPIFILLFGVISIGLSILVAKRGTILNKLTVNQSFADTIGLIPDNKRQILDSMRGLKLHWAYILILLFVGAQVVSFISDMITKPDSYTPYPTKSSPPTHNVQQDAPWVDSYASKSVSYKFKIKETWSSEEFLDGMSYTLPDPSGIADSFIDVSLKKDVNFNLDKSRYSNYLRTEQPVMILGQLEKFVIDVDKEGYSKNMRVAFSAKGFSWLIEANLNDGSDSKDLQDQVLYFTNSLEFTD